MTTDGNFDQRMLRQLANPKVELLARMMARDTKHIRDIKSDTEFNRLPDEITYTFRQMAAQYAIILGVDPHEEQL